MSVIVPKQSVPPVDDGPLKSQPPQPPIFTKVWWLFFRDLAAIINAGIDGLVRIKSALLGGFYPDSIVRSLDEKIGETPSALDFAANGDGSTNSTAAMLTTLAPTVGQGAGIDRLIPTGVYLIDPGVLLIPNPQSSLIHGQGSRFNTVLKSSDNTLTDPILTLGDNTFEPHNFEIHNLSLDADYGPTAGILFFNKANWMGIYGVTIQHFGDECVGISNDPATLLLGEIQFFRCSVYSGDLAGNPVNSIGVLLYPTGNIEFYGCNIENTYFGVVVSGINQAYLLFMGGHIERVGSHAFILKNVQPTIDCDVGVGDVWLGNDVINGSIRLTSNSSAWSNGGVVDNGFGNRITRTSGSLFIPGSKAAYSAGLDFQGTEWLRVESLETDPTFLQGESNWTPGGDGVLSASTIHMPGAPAGKSLLVSSAAGGGYAERTYTAAVNTDYLVQVGILTKDAQTYRIEVLDSGGTVWDSGTFGYSYPAAESQSYKVIRKSIPVTADTVFTVRLYTETAGQTSVIPLLLISRSEIRGDSNYASTGTGLTTSGSGVTFALTQELSTGKVYSTKGSTLTGRAYVRAVVTMDANQQGKIGISADGNSPAGGPEVGLLSGTDVEYIIPVSAYPLANQAIFYDFSGVPNSITVKELGIYPINDVVDSLTLLDDGWVRNDRASGVTALSTEQFHLWLGDNLNGNWQSAASAGNAFTRVVYASNIYWDEVAGNWVVPNNGGGDWAAFVVLNSGEIALACEGGLTPPTTRTNAQFLAAVKFKISTAGIIQALTGTMNLISGSDEGWMRVYNGDPNTHVSGILGTTVWDPTGHFWVKTSGGFGTTGYVDISAPAGAPTSATYITQTPNGSLSAEQALSLLATGILKSTTATGVVSIATFADLPAPGAWTPFSPTVTASIGTATIVTSDCAYRINGKDCLVRYSLQVTIATLAATALYVSLPANPVGATGTYTQAVDFAYTDAGATPRTSWGAIESGANRIVLYLYSGTFAITVAHNIAVNAVYETV